jgi:hypothetical protein
MGIHSSIHSRSQRPDLRSVRNTLPNYLIVTIGGPEPCTPGGIHPMSDDGRNGSRRCRRPPVGEGGCSLAVDNIERWQV